MATIGGSMSNSLFSGTEFNDTIFNGDEHWYGGSNNTIIGNAGNDSIYNSGSFVTISGDEGNDFIRNRYKKTTTAVYGNSVSVSGGKGNDSICNGGIWDSFIGAYITGGSDVTINGGEGDDTIYHSNGENLLIEYKTGDGNDIIYGFNAKSTLSISGNYSSQVSGSDIIVTVGDEKISLMGAASLDNVNISGTEGDSKLITLTEGNDTYSNSLEGATISALGGNDSIYNTDGVNNVSIDGGAGKDTIENYGSNVTINAGAGNDTIITASDGGNTLAGGAGSDIFIFYYDSNYAYGTDYITDYSEEDTIQFNNIAVSKVSTNDSGSVIFKVGKNKLVVKNAADKVVTYIDSDGTTKTFGGSAADEWKLDGSTATYGSLTVKGVTSLDGLSLDGKVVTVSASSLGTEKISVSDGYTLALGSDVSASSTTKSWTLKSSTATYKQTTTAGYKLDGNEIIYSKKSSKTLATVTGVKSLDGLSVNKKIVTVSASSLGTEKISVSDGYTLKLGSDVSSATTKNSWTLKNSTATYKQTTTAGYSLENNEIIYSKKSSKTLATVKGVKSVDGLKLSKKVVTVSAASLGTSNVTISDGYTLALGSDVSASSTTKSWTLKNSTATYKQITSAGYSLVDNEIIYSKKSSKTLATVKGVNDKSGLKVSGKTIKLSGDALSKKVTVSGDYVFDFASDFKNATITGSSSNDTIIARGKNIFVKGGAGADIFQLTSTGTVSDYEEADKISLSSAANISVSGSDVIFNKKITVAGAVEKIVTYIEDSTEKFFAAPVPYNEGVTLAANYAEDTFTANATLVTIDASAVLQPLEIFGNKKANVITGSDEDDYIDGGTGADKIFGRDGNDTLIGGAGNDSLSGGAGDDSLWGSAGTDTLRGGDGSDIFVYKAGDGKIIIEDFEDAWDKIRVLSGSVDVPESDGKDVTFTVDDGQIIIKGGASKYIPIYLGEGNKNIVQKYIPRS